MIQDGDARQPGPAAPAWQHYREPRTFSGKAGEDVDDWLTNYQRVSKYNRWDATVMLANVFFLDSTALTWFENHEASLTSWERFEEEIRNCFGDTTAKRKCAEQTLFQRAQGPGETCTMYIEEVLKLCKAVNPSMSDEDRVGHLLKGIAVDVYNFLITKENLDSPTAVIKHCRTFETLKLRRITPKFGRLPNVTTVASVDSHEHSHEPPHLADMIRQIVRDELSRHQDVNRSAIPCDSCSLQAAPIQRSSWRSTAPPPVRDHRNDSYGPAPPARTHYRAPPPPQQPQRLDFADRFDPVTEDYYLDRAREPPVCYRCGMLGHISRFCRRRNPAPRYQRQWWNRRSTVSPEVRDPTYPPPSGSYRYVPPRNDSPVSDRSLTPPARRSRQSPSPRRSSPPPGN